MQKMDLDGSVDGFSFSFLTDLNEIFWPFSPRIHLATNRFSSIEFRFENNTIKIHPIRSIELHTRPILHFSFQFISVLIACSLHTCIFISTKMFVGNVCDLWNCPFHIKGLRIFILTKLNKNKREIYYYNIFCL